MEDWLSHPLTVATYVALFSLAIGAIRALVKLFDRVKELERSIADLKQDFDLLSTDLRAHMVEEARNVQHLEAAINNVTRIVSEKKIGLRE